jgi:hypothetical protein
MASILVRVWCSLNNGRRAADSRHGGLVSCLDIVCGRAAAVY